MKKGFEKIDVNMTDEVFMAIAKEAHERDITFNQMVTIKLEEYIDLIEKKEKNELSANKKRKNINSK